MRFMTIMITEEKGNVLGTATLEVTGCAMYVYIETAKELVYLVV
jgi:hypothetical protein